jgi:hypothetical protein
MARFFVSATTDEIALVSGTAKTVLQVGMPSNHRAPIIRWGVFFDGQSVSEEPVQVRLLRQTSSGTMTTLDVRALDGSLSESPQMVAQYDASAEPTSGNILDVVEVHPQTGYEMIYPLMQEPIIDGGGRVGIECQASAAVNVRAKIIAEE